MWRDSFLAYARIGRVVSRLENDLGMAFLPNVYVPTMTNRIMNMLEEHGMNFHSPTPAHLMRACQDCNWSEHDKYQEVQHG